MDYFIRIAILAVAIIGFGDVMMCAENVQVVEINKTIESFNQDTILQGSPLELTLSCANISMSGEDSKWHSISTYEFADFLNANAPQRNVSEKRRQSIASRLVLEVYRKDSVAAIISKDKDDVYYSQYSWIENGKWVNCGEDLEFDLSRMREKIKKNLSRLELRRKRVSQVMAIPSNIEPFVEFLTKNECTPIDFIMKALISHKIVVNGEFHRRKVSWDMLIELINRSEFANIVGTIFMELPSHRQSDIEQFMGGEILRPEIILDIFRDEQLNGWWDKGEYDFLCELWKINRTLPCEKRISVVLVDYQAPYSSIKSKKQLDSLSDVDRNKHMADVIEHYIATSDDSRSNLFMVGCGHALKSDLLGVYSGKAPSCSAAFQLRQRFGDKNVFTIYQHDLTGDNMGRYKQPIRAGLFDMAFDAIANKPIGFKLEGSPFGDEPFDGIYEYKFAPDAKTFAHNFDGYLYLCDVKIEPQGEILESIFTQEFIDEMKRRAKCLEMEDNRDFWFGVRACDMTPQVIIDALKNN